MTEKNWFVFKTDHHIGPFSFWELSQLLDQKKLEKWELIWCEGRKKWQPIEEVELFQREEIFQEKEGPKKEPQREICPPQDSSQERVKPLPLEGEKTYLQEGLEDTALPQEELSETPAFEVSPFVGERSLSRLSCGLAFLGVCFGLSAFLFFSSQEPLLEGLDSRSRESLKRATRVPFQSGRPSIRWKTQRRGKGLYLATNYPHLAKLFLRMKAKKGRFLGRQEVVLRSSGVLKGGIAHFKKWEIEKGTQILPGEYQTEVFMDNGNLLTRGTVPFYRGTQKSFSKRLEKFHERQRQHWKPLKDCRQRYESFYALLSKLDALANKDLPSSFERDYNEDVGLALRDLIIDTRRRQMSFLNLNPSLSQYYENSMNLGKEIARLAAHFVETGKKQSFLLESQQLKEEISFHIRKLSFEMEELSL